MDIDASNPGLRDGTKLERFSCWEALLVSRNSSDSYLESAGESVLRKICRLPRTEMKLTTDCADNTDRDVI